MPIPFNPEPICDVCLAPGPEYELRCHKFKVPNRDVDDGRWAICAACKPLIETGDVDALIQRAVDAATTATRIDRFTTGVVMPDGYRRMARNLHTALIDNLICGPFPIDGHCEGCTCESQPATVEG